MPRHFALLPAAGVGARMAVAQPKQYLDLHGRPMLWHAMHTLAEHPAISGLYVVIAADDAWWDTYDWSGFGRLTVLRVGGATRAESVLNGLRGMAGAVQATDWVLVHDAARPCLNRDLLDRLLTALADDAVGGLLAMPVADTLKRADPAQRIGATVPRAGLWAAQTPQMFRHGLLTRALAGADAAVTDEASAVEALGLSPRLVASDPGNLKVTYASDLALAARLLQHA